MWGGQGGCERRIKGFVKIQKKYFWGVGGGGRGLGRGGGGGLVGRVRVRVRVDVNREVEFL